MNIHHIAILFMIAFSLTGCGRQEKLAEVKAYIANLKQEVANEQVKKTPVTIQLPTPVTYQGNVSVPLGENGSENENLEPLNPLEAYPLQSYKFLGTLSMEGKIWAYVLTPGNKVFRLKKEDILSDQYGKVINIEPGRLQVMIQTTTGKQPTQWTVTMRLRD
jgi:Tfp pilus assembly protein PilP